MHRGIASTDVVVAVGIELHLELLIGLNQLFREFIGVLSMDIVVSSAVTDQEMPLEVSRKIQG